MAIITIAAPLSGIRGKVGGLIYSANKGGPYLKAWARGPNPRTLLQTTHQANLGGLAISWKTLTVAEQDAWDTYAALAAQDLTNSLGETYSISGFNWYIRINLNRLSAGDASTAIAPVGGTPTAPTIDFVKAFPTDDPGTTNITLTSGSAGLGERMVIKAVLVNSAGNLATPRVRTFMLTQELDISTLVFPFKSELLEHFGTAQLDQKLFCTIQQQSAEGRRSSPASGSSIMGVTVSVAFFDDTFTVGSDTALTAHTPEIGTGWTQIINEAAGIMEIKASSDTVIYTDVDTSSGCFVTADATYPSADYFIEADLTNVEAGDDTTSLFLRRTSNTNAYYVTFSNSSIIECKIFKVVSGVTTSIASLSQVVANGSTVKFSIIGTFLEVFDDGLSIGSVNDSDLSATGKGGFGFGAAFLFGGNDLDAQEIDNFKMFSN